MNRGIVMKITSSQLIIMTPEGTFEKIAKGNRICQLGDEIYYSPQKRAWSLPTLTRSSMAVAAAVICLVFFISMMDFSGKTKIAAYVSLDINPSVEMGLNSEQEVILMTGLNQDGVLLVEQIEYRGMKYDQVTIALMDIAFAQGYLIDNYAEIVVAGVVKQKKYFDENALVLSIKEQIEERIQTVRAEQLSEYHITTIIAPVDVREKADEKGISAGKYAIYLEANSHGYEIPLEQFKEESIRSIVLKNEGLVQVVQTDAIAQKEYWQQLIQDDSKGELGKKGVSLTAITENASSGKPDKQHGKDGNEHEKESEQQKQEEKRLKEEAERLKEEEKRLREEEKVRERELAEKAKEEEKRLKEEAERQKQEESRLREEEKLREKALREKAQMEEKRLKEEEKRLREEEKAREKELREKAREEEKRQRENEKRQKEEEKRQKEEEKRQKEEEKRQKEEKRQREAEKKRDKELRERAKEEEKRQKENEKRLKEEEVRQKEAEKRRKEEEARQKEAEKRRKDDEAKNRKEEERRHKKEQVHLKMSEAKQKIKKDLELLTDQNTRSRIESDLQKFQDDITQLYDNLQIDESSMNQRIKDFFESIANKYNIMSKNK